MKISTADMEPRWLLSQYYDSLAVSFFMAKEMNPDVSPALLELIEDLFKETENRQQWSIAYAIEQYLTYLYDDEMLEEQIERRMIDLVLHSDDERYRSFSERRDKIQEKRAKQELLRDITSNVQWYYRKRDVRRDYHRKARLKALNVFGLALIAFSGVLIASYSDWPLDYTKYDPTTRTLVIGICAGFLGASFSMLLRIKAKSAESAIDDLRAHDNYHYAFLRPFIGVGAALIFFFLVQSKILAGELFPILPLPIPELGCLTKLYSDISKMIVWSFISGFSEYFVPNLLDQKESNALGKVGGTLE